jgi:hypothetical protein
MPDCNVLGEHVAVLNTGRTGQVRDARQGGQQQADAGRVGVIVPQRGPESVLFMAGPPAGASSQGHSPPGFTPAGDCANTDEG